MPVPVSDSYDPEFSTGQNARDVREAIEDLVEKATRILGPELRNIVGVVHGGAGRKMPTRLSEREWRIIRFALNRAIETI